MRDYNESIWDLAEQLIEGFSIRDQIEPGVNGPYNDKETIVRNLSHLIIITSIYIKNKNKEAYMNLLDNMGSILLGLRDENGLYILRVGTAKDTSNGVIGHAWVIEALIYLYKMTKKNKYLEEAINIYKQHNFNRNLGLWNRPSITGTISSIDYTLNHQLWFASSASEIYSLTYNNTLKSDINIFLKKLPTLFRISSKGLICHEILSRERALGNLKLQIKRYMDIVNRVIDRPSYYYKENGYHLFNIFALARIYEIFPELEFWNSIKFKKAMDYLHSNQLKAALLSDRYNKDKSLKNNIPNEFTQVNVYGYPYNVPGFEILYVKRVFGSLISRKLIDEFMERQWVITYDNGKRTFSKGCSDKVTINYRIYEYLKGLELR